MTITIDPAATNHPFSVWDYCAQSFVIKPGQYRRLRRKLRRQHSAHGDAHSWVRL